MENYPAVALVVKFGTWLALFVAAAPVAGAACAVFGLGAHWAWLPVAIGVGALGGLLMKTMVEITTIITDMLLPK
jgi:hypothetical protein